MQQSTDPLHDLFKRCKSAFFSVAFFSALTNLLMLTVPLFTLQLYDRVLVSQSADTLLYLSVIAIFAIAIYAILEFLRSRILTEVAHWLDNQISPNIISKSVDQLLMGNRYGFESQRDISILKTFLKSPALFSFLDMPWLPIYLIAIFIMSEALGVITFLGALILFFLAFLNQKITSQDLHKAATLSTPSCRNGASVWNDSFVFKKMDPQQ